MSFIVPVLLMCACVFVLAVIALTYGPIGRWFRGE